MDFLGAPLATRTRREPSSYLRGWEKRREADERVEQNLDPWEIPTWRKHRALFKGSPEKRTRAFRDWLEERDAETRGERSSAAEKETSRLVREKREREKGVKVPCRRPWRFRTRAACAPAERKVRRPRWSLFAGASKRIEVPCEEPFRFSVKALCAPPAKTKKKKHATWAALVKTTPKPAGEEPGIFDDLLYG
jgi:hypothetical protein